MANVHLIIEQFVKNATKFNKIYSYINKSVILFKSLIEINQK